jgi:hypothetical protein
MFADTMVSAAELIVFTGIPKDSRKPNRPVYACITLAQVVHLVTGVVTNTPVVPSSNTV